MASIRKRSWTSRGVRKERWVVDYVDQAGARHIKTFSSKKAADNWLVIARHEVREGTHSPESSSLTVAEATERWIVHCEAEGLEHGTIVQRRQHLNLHIAPFLGGELLASLTTPRVHQFIADLRDAGRSLAMRRKVLTNLKTILSYAQGQGLVAQNVARGIKLKSDQRYATEPLREGHDFPSRAELKTLIDNSPPRWRPFIVTAVFTGMRASELRGLRWADVDLDRGVIHVRQRADNWRNLGAPKSAAGKRDIPLTPLALNTLRSWRTTCPPGELGLVFPNGAGKIESHANLRNRVFIPLQISAGLVTDTGEAKYGLHALRHAAASLFIAHLGWTPKRIQAVMGHVSITMTFDRYGHLFADAEGDREAMKKLEAAVLSA
jgi:integrase